MKNYLAFYAPEYEYEYFETFEQAEKWLKDLCNDVGYDGFPEETLRGEDFIAQITHRSKFTETDRKDNYKYVYEDDIPEDDNKSEAWPYDSCFDIIGKITFELTK